PGGSSTRPGHRAHPGRVRSGHRPAAGRRVPHGPHARRGLAPLPGLAGQLRAARLSAGLQARRRPGGVVRSTALRRAADPHQARRQPNAGQSRGSGPRLPRHPLARCRISNLPSSYGYSRAGNEPITTEGGQVMKFMLLIYGDEQARQKATPADIQKEGAAYEEFTKSIVASGNFLDGDPFEQTGNAQAVEVRGG